MKKTAEEVKAAMFLKMAYDKKNTNSLKVTSIYKSYLKPVNK